MEKSETLHLFIGYDDRQPVSFTACAHSAMVQSSVPLAIHPIMLDQVPIKRRGLTPFTFSRFLTPWMMNFKGKALFVDADIIFRCDIKDVFDAIDMQKPVTVSKNKMRFEWAAVMGFNCAKCTMLTPEFVQNTKSLHTIEWIPENEVGAFPDDFNHLVGYDEPNPEARVVHFTQGIPAFPETSTSEFADEWTAFHQGANAALSWKELMGNSVHATRIGGMLMPKLALNAFRKASGE